MKQVSFISNSKTIEFLKRGIAIVVTVSLIVGGAYFIQEITRLKKTGNSGDILYKSYFEDPSQYDVLFLGTSHLMYGISPLEIWNEYGITSYNWGSPTCSIPTIYWKMINILDYQTPELVVVDCFRATWEQKTYSEARIHEALDAFPLSYHKYMAVKDLMDGQIRKEDGLEYSKQEQINVLMPLSAYHTRWDSLDERDFHGKDMDTKGSELFTDVDIPIEISNTSAKTEITENMQGVVYLKKIIEECQSRDIPILLTYLPYPTSEQWKMEANMIDDIASEYGVDYLDFTKLDVVNYNTDFSDSESHMNVSGEEKVSKYMGRYIVENFEVDTRTSDEKISADWNDKYDEYKAYREGLILDQSVLKDYLMLLHDTSHTVIIEVKDNNIFANELLLQLLQGVCEDVTIDEHTSYLVVKDGKAVALTDFTDDGATCNTDIGVFSLKYNDDKTYSILLDKEEVYVGDPEEYSMAIRVLDGLEQFDHVKFNLSDENGLFTNDQLIR